MTTQQEAVSSNETLHTRIESATAIFTGATHGIGLGTLRAFIKHVPKPKVIIIGRNRARFEDELKRFTELNKNSDLTFLELDLSLIKNVDAVCAQLKNLLSNGSVDVLSMSQGYAPLEGRRYNTEGLDEVMTLCYYGRVRMVQNLLSSGLLAPKARVLSILAGGKEAHIFQDDLPLEENYSLMNLRGHVASLMTLSFDAFASRDPLMTFMHIHPGRVATNLGERGVSTWWGKLLFKWLMDPAMAIGAMTAKDCGERMLELGFRQDFAGGRAGSDECWALGYDGMESRSKELVAYRKDVSVRERIWEWNLSVFENVVGK